MRQLRGDRKGSCNVWIDPRRHGKLSVGKGLSRLFFSGFMSFPTDVVRPNTALKLSRRSRSDAKPIRPPTWLGYAKNRLFSKGQIRLCFFGEVPTAVTPGVTLAPDASVLWKRLRFDGLAQKYQLDRLFCPGVAFHESLPHNYLSRFRRPGRTERRARRV
jgi:hypothetical protein